MSQKSSKEISFLFLQDYVTSIPTSPGPPLIIKGRQVLQGLGPIAKPLAPAPPWKQLPHLHLYLALTFNSFRARCSAGFSTSFTLDTETQKARDRLATWQWLSVPLPGAHGRLGWKQRGWAASKAALGAHVSVCCTPEPTSSSRNPRSP